MFIIQFSPRNIVYSGDFHYGLHELMWARLELEPPWGKRTLVTEFVTTGCDAMWRTISPFLNCSCWLSTVRFSHETLNGLH